MMMDTDEEAVVKGKGKASPAEAATDRALAAHCEKLEEKVTTLKRVLMAYQRLTSLCVSLEQAPKKAGAGGVSTLRCTAVNHVHKKALEFQVRPSVRPSARCQLRMSCLTCCWWW